MTSRSHPSSRVGQPGGGDRGDRRGIGDHEPDPRRRQRRVDRQIGRPGLQHRQNRHDRLGGPGKQQRHTLPRARPVAGQQVRQPVRRLLELAVGPSSGPRQLSATASGARATCAANNTGIDTGAVAGSGQHRPVAAPHPAGRAHRHRAHPSTTTAGRRVGGHRHQHPLATARSASRCWPRRTRRCETPPSRKSRRAHRPRSSVRPGKMSGPCGRSGCPPAAG